MTKSGEIKGPAYWDQRFAEAGYAYGDAPNAFMASAAYGLPAGTALSLAEGEGRNAVWLAQQGHRVEAVDFSAVGRDKALALAHRKGVTLEYRLADLADLPWEPSRWDLVVAIFSQPLASVRRRLHAGLAQALRPGGHFILESKVEPGSGPDARYPGVDHLRAELMGLDILFCEEAVHDLAEGRYHVGAYRTARLVARRPVAAG